MYPFPKKQSAKPGNSCFLLRNLLKPADGEPIIGPSKDMVLGVYYLTKNDDTGVIRVMAVFLGLWMKSRWHTVLDQVDVQTEIKSITTTWYDDEGNRLAKPEERLIETTVGRVIFNRILPPEVQFVKPIL